MFSAGKKDGEASEYDGGRTASDIVAWALDKLAENVPPPEIVQVRFSPLLILSYFIRGIISAHTVISSIFVI